MSQHKDEEVQPSNVEASPEARWEAFAARFREGMKSAPEWTENYGAFSRTVQMPEGSFSLTREGVKVMGPRSDEYRCNLMPLFEELGIADDFTTFELVCSTYGVSAEKVGAVLKPKQEASAPMEVVLKISPPPPKREKKRDQMRSQPSTTLRLRPHESRGSANVRISYAGEPEGFAFQLNIRISEFIPDYDSEGNE